MKIDAKSRHLLLFGTTPIELDCVEQLVDIGQTLAIGNAIHLTSKGFMDGRRTLKELVTWLEEFFDKSGLDPLDPFYQEGRHPGSFTRPRRYEIAGAINRLRTVRMGQK